MYIYTRIATGDKWGSFAGTTICRRLGKRFFQTINLAFNSLECYT